MSSPAKATRLPGKKNHYSATSNNDNIKLTDLLVEVLENEINAINAGRYVPVYVNNVPVSALVDSGNSAGCCISAAFAKEIGLTASDLERHNVMIGTAKKGASLTCLGKTIEPIKVTFAGTNFTYEIRPFVIKELSSHVNLSLSFLEDNNIDQLHSIKGLRVQNQVINMHARKQSYGVQNINVDELQDLNAYIAEDVVVPANSAKFVKIRIPKLETLVWYGGSGVLTLDEMFIEKYDMLPAKHSIVMVDNNGKTVTAVLNDSDTDVLVRKNVKFGTFDSATIDKRTKLAKRLNWPREKIVKVFRLDESQILKNDKTKMDIVVSMLDEFGTLFSEDKENYGNSSLVRHTIDTGDAKPIKQRVRPLNEDLKAKLDKQIDSWLKKDIIEESNSPWSSRLVPVNKKNTTDIRWCVDYRQLNNITVKDTFPLPNIEESLTKMANCNVFSALDGTGAYHAVHIDEADREKTAFACHRGTYHFKRMPFGLCNAPATFSRPS